jgi:predicted protein tyrosine phosphatase
MSNTYTFRSEKLTITFCSYDVAECITPDETATLISIKGTDESNSINYRNWKHVLKLSFDDITERKTAEDRLFNTGHAARIIDFIVNLPAGIRSITVHCFAGVSRSAAVARFLSGTVYTECRDRRFEAKYELYNPVIYRILARVWNRRLRREQLAL